jgi:hypothetical protein
MLVSILLDWRYIPNYVYGVHIIRSTIPIYLYSCISNYVEDTCVEYRTNRIRESHVNAQRYKLDEKDFQENTTETETVANERLADLLELNNAKARPGSNSKPPSETETRYKGHRGTRGE